MNLSGILNLWKKEAKQITFKKIANTDLLIYADERELIYHMFIVFSKHHYVCEIYYTKCKDCEHYDKCKCYQVSFKPSTIPENYTANYDEKDNLLSINDISAKELTSTQCPYAKTRLFEAISKNKEFKYEPHTVITCAEQCEYKTEDKTEDNTCAKCYVNFQGYTSDILHQFAINYLKLNHEKFKHNRTLNPHKNMSQDDLKALHNQRVTKLKDIIKWGLAQHTKNVFLCFLVQKEIGIKDTETTYKDSVLVLGEAIKLFKDIEYKNDYENKYRLHIEVFLNTTTNNRFVNQMIKCNNCMKSNPSEQKNIFHGGK